MRITTMYGRFRTRFRDLDMIIQPLSNLSTSVALNILERAQIVHDSSVTVNEFPHAVSAFAGSLLTHPDLDLYMWQIVWHKNQSGCAMG